MIETLRTFLINCFYCCHKKKIKIDNDIEQQKPILETDELFTEDTDEDFIFV